MVAAGSCEGGAKTAGRSERAGEGTGGLPGMGTVDPKLGALAGSGKVRTGAGGDVPRAVAGGTVPRAGGTVPCVGAGGVVPRRASGTWLWAGARVLSFSASLAGRRVAIVT